ncbi:MAG: ParB N-terminal domain-containing protein [Dongiaceae bacterium]
MADQHLMKPVVIKIEQIYVPAALRKPLDPRKLEEIAVSIADIGQQSPILVRPDKARPSGERPSEERYVLVSGLHRLEACRALGEATIIANLVQARKH